MVTCLFCVFVALPRANVSLEEGCFLCHCACHNHMSIATRECEKGAYVPVGYLLNFIKNEHIIECFRCNVQFLNCTLHDGDGDGDVGG